jgi:hypothetical protein
MGPDAVRWPPLGRRLAGLALNLCLALASILVVLVALEVALRVSYGRAAARGRRTTELADYSEYDPVLGWRKRAGVALHFVRREYELTFTTNSHGLRDTERGYQAAVGVERVLALGDSYVEGYGVRLDETVTQRLEASLRESGCGVDVINGATTGYATDQEYLFYLNEGVRYSPSIVVLFFYYNDIYSNDSQFFYEGIAKPVFVFRNGRFEVHKQPVATPAPRPKAVLAVAEAPAAPRWLLREWLQERLWFGAPHLYNRLGRLGLWEPNRTTDARLELRVFSTERIPRLEGGWEKTEALLRSLGEDVRSRGARLLVAYIPARFEVNDRAWQLTVAKYQLDEPRWNRRLVRMRLEDIASRNGILLLDLTPALRRADHGWHGGPYYEYDGHWNALGHAVAAAEVRERLRGQSWLTTCR